MGDEYRIDFLAARVATAQSALIIVHLLGDTHVALLLLLALI